jgi:hypothetical protein
VTSASLTLVRDPAALRAYVDRDWSSAARDDEHAWIEQARRQGPAGGVRIAGELRRQVVAMHPDWPSQQERDEDLATHLRVIDALRRVPVRSR